MFGGFIARPPLERNRRLNPSSLIRVCPTRVAARLGFEAIEKGLGAEGAADCFGGAQGGDDLGRRRPFDEVGEAPAAAVVQRRDGD